jgi:TPR repeat protein
MVRKMLFALILIVPLSVNPAMASGQEPTASSEDVKTRLGKQEIIGLMVQMRRLSSPEQNSRLDAILRDSSGSKTPRSDFLLCAGLAYLGNYKAQRFVGSAYENGRGVVEDLSDAYVWYAIAQENTSADEAMKQTAQAARDRVKDKLVSTYPSPTDEDLDDLIKEQKSRMAQYQEEAKK